MSEKKCSKCGEAFTCKHEEMGCWCERVKLSEETLKYLKEHYDNCLCPDCLGSFETENKMENADK